MEQVQISGSAAEAERASIERASIDRIVARLSHAQQHELVDEFVGLFRADAIWTTGGGKRLTGRAEIAAFTRQVLPGAMTDLIGTYEVVDVLFIRPDVAAVKVRQTYTDRAGRPVEGEGTPLYVMSKEDGRWLLVAGQNTPVATA
jgi:uncharacterized protein (TIGR02246 family)